MRRVDSGLLAILGVLIAHEIAYLTSAAVGYETSIAHGHLKTAWLVGSVALLALVSRAIVTSLRRRRHDGGNVLHLAGSIAGGYFLMEQFERAIDGYGAFDIFSEPVFWFGLAAAPLVAAALSWSLRSVEQAVSRFIDTSTPDAHSLVEFACTLCITSLTPRPSPALSSVVSRRGPPQR